MGGVEHVTDPLHDPFLGIFYSIPGGGKTRLAAASTAVLGPAVYFALDNRGIESVLPEHLKKLHVIKLSGDPVENMNEIAIHPWKKDFPDAKTLIVDTLTTGAKGMLKEAANKMWFRGEKGDSHITFGPKDAAITQKIPILADYGGGIWLVENWLQLLVATQRDMNIIVLCHEDLDIPKKDDPGDKLAVGGPATFGRKLLTWLPSEFPVVARLKVDATTNLEGKVTAKYRVITAMQGNYIARIREGNAGGNPIPIVTLDVNAENWWREYAKHFMPWAKQEG